MKRLLAAMALLLCAACAPDRPTATPTATLAPTAARVAPTATLSPPASATPRACLSEPGRIIREEYLEPGMPRSLPYRVYLPPCYQGRPQAPLPLLILIHGLQSTDSQWDDIGVDEAADALIRAGSIPSLVIVMPWERRGLDFEDAVAGKLLPHIRAAYAGDAGRQGTAIGGLSRGAGWALRIGLKHPELFGSVGLHSPAVLPPDMYYLPGWIEEARRTAGVPRIWIDVADHDTSRAGAKDLAALLDDLNVVYAWSSAPGEHSAPYWTSRLSDYLRWYAESWNRGPTSGDAPAQ